MSASSVAQNYDMGYADGYQDGVFAVLNRIGQNLSGLTDSVMEFNKVLEEFAKELDGAPTNADIPTAQ